MLTQAQIEDTLRGKQLVFLVGAPRSGTTWLQLLLSRSPLVVTAPETHVFSLFLRPMVDQWNRLRKTGERIGLNQLLSEEEFRGMLRGISGFVFAKIAQSRPSATVVLDKTPNHVSCWREILDAWPEAQFIHIIRDPRSVVASLRVASRSWAAHWASSRITTNCERWIADVISGQQIKSATSNYQEVTFQELISCGPDVVMRLLTKLGVQSSRDECQRYVDECKIDNLKAGRLNNAPFDVGKMNKESFRHGTTDGWRKELSVREIALVERLAGSLMSEYGFMPVNRSKIVSALLDLDCTIRYARRGVKWQLQSLAERL
jgi:Sulfotransferase family